MKIAYLIIILLVLLGVAGGLLYVTEQFESDDAFIACTQEAKLCPDGTAVGRTGPNCEFAACPGEADAVPGQGNSCIVAGCSGTLCVDAEAYEENPIFTTCEYLPEYACYETARCERQDNGVCGWTETTELEACLNQYQ